MKKFTNFKIDSSIIGFPLYSGKLGFSIPILINEEDLNNNYQILVKKNFLF